MCATPSVIFFFSFFLPVFLTALTIFPPVENHQITFSCLQSPASDLSLYGRWCEFSGPSREVPCDVAIHDRSQYPSNVCLTSICPGAGRLQPCVLCRLYF